MAQAQREQGSKTRHPWRGLYTTPTGPAAPADSAEDVVNIDFQMDTIRGRSASERIFTTQSPEAGVYFDGRWRWSVTDANDDDFAMADGWTVRAYIAGIDITKLLDEDTNTIWCIAESGGTSADIENPTHGWTLYLKKTTATNISLIFSSHDGAGNQDLTLTGFEGNVDSPADVFCVEVASNDTLSALEYFKNGSNSAEDLATDAGVDATATDTGNHHLAIGSFRNGTTDTYLHNFLGIIGNVELHNNASSGTMDGHRWLRFSEAELPSELVAAFQPTEGEGYVSTMLVKTSIDVKLHPRPPTLVSSKVEFDALAYGELDLSKINIDGTKGWGAFFEITPREYVKDANAPPWVFISQGTNNVEFLCTLVQGTSTTTQVKANFSIGLDDGGTLSSVFAQTGDLTIGTTYRVGFFVESDFDAAVSRDTDIHVSWTISGTWQTPNTDTGAGLPDVSDLLTRFGTSSTQNRFSRFAIGDFRFFQNIDIPTNAAGFLALDDYTPTWPVGLAVTFDASDAASVFTETTPDGLSRVTEWRDNRQRNISIKFFPRYGLTSWAALAHQARGPKPKIHGVVPSIELRGDGRRRLINLVQQGGVYRWDQDASSGEWLQHPCFAGVPTNGVRGIDLLERVILFGEGMASFKVFPNGAGNIGLPEPYVNSTLVSSSPASPNTGGLLQSKTYNYKFTVYNSATGLESNAYRGVFTDATLTGEEMITHTISELCVYGTDDWDTLRLYRQEQGGELYYLEQEVPRPPRLPPGGPDIVVESRLEEALLVLNELRPLDADPPPLFTAAAIADNRLVVGGSGPHPGWAFYSEPFRHEAFPPLNVWTLDDNDGNIFRGVYVLFGRLLILKSRNLWAAREEAASLGESPKVIQGSRGCVSASAHVEFDNNVAFLSPDRAIYATDGLEVADISSNAIRETLRDFTDAQLNLCQASHDAQSKQVWFLIGGQCLVYQYDKNVWTIFEMPVDGLGVGHSTDAGGGEHAVWGYRGYSYRLARDNKDNEESDYSGSETDFILSYTGIGTGLRVNGAGDVIALDGTAVETDIEGLPCILVAHTTARSVSDPLASSYYEPIFEIATRSYNHIAGVGGSSNDRIYLGEPFNEGASTRVTIYIGMQYRRYLSQRMAPQGEGYPYLFFGSSFLKTADMEATDTAWLRFRYDDDTTYQYQRLINAAVRDQSFWAKKSGRSIQWRLDQAERGDVLEVSKVITRFRIRSSARRKKY